MAEILSTSGAALIDDWDIEGHTGTSFVFVEPVSTIVACTPDELQNALHEIVKFQAKGLYCAGYISYDAGLGLDKPMRSRFEPNVPLLYMGVYDKAAKLDRADARFDLWDSPSAVRNSHLNVTEDEYLRSVERIKEYISAGDVYQVNYTCKLLFENTGAAAGLFARLREAHPVCCSSFINTGDFQVISLSPELFLRKTGSEILTRPMKGTSIRGRSSVEDNCVAASLSLDEKNCAENLMIVDLMRNDIGRVCEYGSVHVPRLFHIERYRTVFQMTSDVSGTIRDGISLPDIMNAAFPPGSVTGAPKLRAVEIIDELESDSRGVYCGCVGMFCPDGDFLLNVAIRTIVQRGNACELGIGSGIVADSDPHLELEETLLKSSFLYSEPYSFDLLETLLYDGQTGFDHCEAHIQRMRDSAGYFGYRFDEAAMHKALGEAAEAMNGSLGAFRVRLLSSEHGEARAEWTQIGDSPNTPIRLLISERIIDPQDRFLYHKTTNREAYDNELAAAREIGFFDTLYFNNRGEITECSITNICVKLDGCWYTPPVDCGLLPGIWRQALISSGDVSERILTLDDIISAEAVMIGNSVRGAIVVDSIQKLDSQIVYTAKSV
ncbi:MAG: aminodeoxychorismate synthase component I [Armatimonadetes bacterium]|nr:aminodeoxychorismate synthase component I [Armatimonadota bacterium]